MTKPNSAQVEAAKRLLSYEGWNGGSAEECAAAAGRVYDKLEVLLSPLLGPAGVRALFARSATLSQREFPSVLSGAVAETSTSLRECLRAQEAGACAASAASLFGAFLELITTFIGERLTTEVLRRIWPAIVVKAPEETNE